MVTNGLGGPRSGACALGAAWNAPTNLSLPLLAVASLCTVLRTGALTTVNRSPWKLLVMDSGAGSCLFWNSYTMKAYSNTGGLIDCVYSGQKELSALTAPVLLCPWEGSCATSPTPNILTFLPRAPCYLTGCTSRLCFVAFLSSLTLCTAPAPSWCHL